jgi:hypothetical protein
MSSKLIPNLGATNFGSWTNYTPTNSGITVGNGTQLARYTEVGKMVTVSYKFILGSTSSVSGAVTVGLPFAIGNNTVATCAVITTDFAGATYTSMGFIDSSTGGVLIRPVKTNATYGTWDDNLGGAWSWATSDNIYFTITYEKV